ncbi:DUF4225 domain-containing protein [Pseudomonas sp. Irchel 3E13]|uniref:DUF4225 domain-containing protein n=1 Tax=Pseudomonas sp. Irchel 3E13 TaxID=2008975 RepID=UPI00211475C2|nr:DUF4225 domain-containing protein [Pseudomonas sp. Irchel 3E13]
MRRPSPYPLETHDYWIVSDAAAKLTQYASIVGSRYIADMALRGRFKREMAYYAKQVVDAVGRGEISSEEGLRVIEAERKSLGLKVVEIGRKGLGLVAGSVQIVTGAGLCATWAGCVVGLPLALHGANNFYENGDNLLTGQSDSQGPVKKIYQTTARALGGSTSHGNIAYGLADIGFSGYGVFKKVLKPGAWSLFRPINSDYIRAYQGMGAGALSLEAIFNVLTVWQIYEDSRK